jgi:acyl-[acyl-carrier-protein]-phospholipid O-acyltransferase/long-chain-fatty-acid--[acyl-carrier-protein] ligase
MLLARTLILRRLLERSVLDCDEENVGLLLPPSAAGFATNIALALTGRVAVNLNYSLSAALIEDAVAQAEVRRILTSRQVLERLDLELETPTVFLEDLAAQATWRDKLVATLIAYVLPAGIIHRLLRIPAPPSDRTLTIIFTAGSSGTPKGVVLSHGNIEATLAAIDQVFRLRESDVLLGVLPFFHAFGYTGTLWTVATFNVAGAFHVSPLEAREIGRLCRRQGGTILLATPTFLRGYISRCSPRDFISLDTVVVGAERLPPELADQFEQRFGVRPVEGYGATELSPLVSVNLPPSRRGTAPDVGARAGTVGRPVPGVELRVDDPESGSPRENGATGLIRVRGANVMQGYYGRPDLTAEVLHDGWYATGDIGHIEADGYLVLTDRAIRISKIGGEMVSHSHVEQELARVLPPDAKGDPRVAVTALPDAHRGERLVVLYVGDETPQTLRRSLRESGLPALMIPSADGFLRVAQIPQLGAGKLDLTAVRALAADRLAQTDARTEL